MRVELELSNFDEKYVEKVWLVVTKINNNLKYIMFEKKKTITHPST
jgi:hypothetical protein